MLRRLKSDVDDATGKPLVSLPPRTSTIHRLEFSRQEQLFYDELFVLLQSVRRALFALTFVNFYPFIFSVMICHRQEMRALFRSNAAKGNYSQVLVMLLRLRQSCNHVLLATGARGENICFDAQAERSTDNVGLALRQAAEVAGFQFASDAPQSSASFDHSAGQIHMGSLERLLGNLTIQCATPGVVPDSLDLADVSDDGAHWHFGSSSTSSDSHESVVSTKIEWLVQQLQRVRKADLTDKCVVFSQWTSMLDLIETRLHSEGFGCARLDGECSAQQRADAIRSFTESPATEIFVFLVSLKAGGVGLNLVRANHTFMMDSWFNPSGTYQMIR